MSRIDPEATERGALRHLRGLALQMLQSALAAGGMQDELLERELRGIMPGVSAVQMVNALVYLQVAGLIEKEHVKRDRLDKGSVAFWKLTVKGMQIVEGVAEDPGVELT